MPSNPTITTYLGSYVEAKDMREVVDITQLNSELKTTVTKINKLRADIDVIVAEIECEGVAWAV